MTAPFVTALRSRTDILPVSPPGPGSITIRVQMPEVWDVVAMSVASNESVLIAKKAALDAFFPEAERHWDFVVKHRGWEILDEKESLAGAGVVDGSILLLTHRRRRAVR